MSIVGNAVKPQSVGIQPPYMRFTLKDTTNRLLSSIALVGFTIIPDSLCYFGGAVNKDKVTSVDLTDSPGITSVGEYGFYGFRNATFDPLPSTIKNVGDYGFYQCSKLSDLPSQLENIGASAFAVCSGLSTSELPINVKSIGYQAFYRCTGLTISTLPDGAYFQTGGLGGSCFSGCTGITSMVLPDSVTTLVSDLFMDCTNLVTVDLPSTLTSVSTYAFHRCSKLTTIYCRASTPPTMANSAGFGTVSALAHIYVPSASVDAYKTATNWSQYASKISAIPT